MRIRCVGRGSQVWSVFRLTGLHVHWLCTGLLQQNDLGFCLRSTFERAVRGWIVKCNTPGVGVSHEGTGTGVPGLPPHNKNAALVLADQAAFLNISNCQ